jgi:hypothetical protein
VEESPVTKRFREEQNAVRKSMRQLEALSGKSFAGIDTTPIAEPPKRAVKQSTEPSEHQIQCAVVKWWQKQHKLYGLPEFALFAVPNAARRTPQLASYLGAEGMKAGVPDLLLDVPRGPYHGMRLETKTKIGRLSSAQEEFRDYYLRAGYQWVLYRTPEDGIDAIRVYLNAIS